MKILQVAHTFLPKFVAGTEIYTFEISQALKSKKNNLRIAYTDPLANAYTLRKLDYGGIICYEIQKDINNVFSFEDSFQDKQVEDFFIDILDDYQPDVIHYQHLMFLSNNIIKQAKKRNIKQLMSLHDFWFQCLTHKRITTDNTLCVNPTIDKCIKCHTDLLNRTLPVPASLKTFSKNFAKKIKNNFYYHYRKKLLKKQLLYRLHSHREVLQSVDLVIYPTKFLQDELYQWELKGKNNLISNDGIQDKYFRNFKKTHSKTLRFGFIGSIVPAKGLMILVKAWEKIKRNHAVLQIYGNFSDDPHYAKNVKQIIANCKNIEIKGAFKPDQIAKIFKQIDVLIIPSTWFENAPLVLRNSFLAKTPVIGTNLGGISELIKDGVNGFLFENENSDDLAKKIDHIINNPEILKKFRFPKQKTIDENAQELIRLYARFKKNKYEK